MDKAKLKDKELSWDNRKCGKNTDLGGNDILLAVGIYQVPDTLYEDFNSACIDTERTVDGEVAFDRYFIFEQ